MSARKVVGIVAAIVVLWGIGPARSGAQAPATLPKRPAGLVGTVVIPDHFLRRWDPVTIFFDHDLGPQKGPEDHADKYVTVSPAQPGAYEWLDARTLQFRPADPWPSLTRFTWTAGGKPTTLTTLMAAPTETLPADGATGLDPVREIRLSFAEPLEPDALSRMVGIELRALPGVGGEGGRWLSAGEFAVKALERGSDGKAGYLLVLKQDVPLGTRVVLHLRLSLDDQGAQSFKDIAFATAEPFRVLSFGCRGKQYPVTPAGSRYSREQAIACDGDGRKIVVEFSSAPKEVGPVIGRNLVRFTPAVPKLTFEMQGRTLEIGGDFSWDTLYSVALVPATVEDGNGRALDLREKSEVFFHFPRRPAYVRLKASYGIVERFGAQMVPVDGRGQERVDIRVHKIDPLDRSFWPFPEQVVVTSDARRPAGPGEEPKPFTSPDRNPGPGEITQQISALGSPSVSAIVTLPLRREGGAASFGLELAPHFERVTGKGEPGTYLVGLRDLGAGTERSWMRVQVTDLAVATFEEPRAVRFVVTSLSTGLPVIGAKVEVQGTVTENLHSTWTVLESGTTDTAGAYRWRAPGWDPARIVRRLVVQKDGDMLVLDASRPPEKYADNQWSASSETWLQWVYGRIDQRGPQPETLCHIFTERPLYRPEEEVHIKGYLRHREAGALSIEKMSGWLIVEGPGDRSWKYPVEVGGAGSFYQKFKETDLPTGTYRVHLEDQARRNHYGSASFQLEAYRLPRFEITLHAPDQAPLDRPFDVSLTASYYAGGKVGGQPVSWRVSQFPYAWVPKAREGFVYSSDGRFSKTERFQSSPRLDKDDTTTEEGSSQITLDPTIEATAQSRTYVIEATVTGPDDQTVTATRSILALPPFVLGVKAPRFVEHAKSISPEIIVVGPDGELMADKEVTVRLLRREWHSHLRASDFSDGVARYLTDVVDEKVSETKVQSTAAPLPLKMPIDRPGVYVVELEARDKLDRAQVVSVDLFAGGEGQVAWPKPPTKVFSVSPDRAKYDPGMSAAIVLKSPFQSAHALAVIEAPEGNVYQWLPVVGGTAIFHVPILGTYTPKVPVHFLLVRGRLPGTKPSEGNNLDLGKPATLAATAWLEVNPVANQAVVTLQYPETARPGQKIDMTISLKDPQGKPLAGEVTLWLVDQAVLALAKEARLDPLPDFITKVRSHLEVRDTRNLAFGELAFADVPGGDGDGEKTGLLDRATVRKNFKTVPYYNPAILVGPDGIVKVPITLSDDLTNFKIRAKAVSGPQRMGYAVGHLAVRLPVIVQPALPRFVRPGDTFTASAIARIVEGAGGPGIAEMKAEGVTLAPAAARRDLTFAGAKPERLDFPVSVTTPPYDAEGKLSRTEVSFKVGVERSSDKAADAFEVHLPIRDDREPVRQRQILELLPGSPFAIPAVVEKARPGTARRSVLLSDQAALVKMAAGLDFLMEYPYGCTEQKTSRARAYIAFQKFRAVLKQSGNDKDLQRAVAEALDWIPLAIDEQGLVAYWPGSEGYVSLTAWTVQFLVEAKTAGFAVDEKLLSRLLQTLQQALRSDYSHFIDGEAFTERAWALAALAQAGEFNPAYAAELARKAEYLDLDGVAEVLQAFAKTKEPAAATVDALSKNLWDGLVVRLHQGNEIYGGLQTRQSTRNGLILPGETRTLAEITRALTRVQPKNARVPVLVSALVTLGRDDGWGTTNANASAMLALSEVMDAKPSTTPSRSVKVTLDGKLQTAMVGGPIPVAVVAGTTVDAGELALVGGGAPLVARIDTTYVPAADGSQAAAQSSGFVVTREILRVKKDAPPEKIALGTAGTSHTFAVGDIIEEHVQIVNPKARHYVAVVVPMAAGVEPLNPALATAPPEAKSAGSLTLAPTYASYEDDRVAYYYNSLPAGTYDFYFRTRATIPGSFIQPPARAEMMYDGATRGQSNGARLVIERKEN